MNKKIKIIIISFFIIFLFIMMYLLNYLFFIRYDISENSIKVRNNDTISKVFKNNDIDYGIIDKIIFKYFIKKDLRIGNYLELKKPNKYEIIYKLFYTDPKETVIKLTIPEGFTNEKIFKRLESLGLPKKEEILAVLKDYEFYYPHSENFEGYFYPDTYYFLEDDDAKTIVDKILGEFLLNFPPENYKDKDEFYNNLILASIVESEAVKKEDVSKIAGVFKHRLRINMKLESDATLRYVLENNRQALKTDLKNNNSEYNTYKHYGLTPSPINNPSKYVILETINATEDKNLFFLEKDGNMYYSKTHKEHLKLRNE